MSKPSAILHIGLSKTSTSLTGHLIRNVREQLSQLLDMKIGGIGEDIWQVLLTDLQNSLGTEGRRLPPFMQIYRQGFSLSDAAKAQIETLCEAYFVTENSKVLVLQEGYSDLIVFGPEFTDDSNFNFIISTIGAHADIDLVVFVRRQTDFLGSFYMQSVREGAVWTFQEYLSAFNLDNLDWFALAEGLSAHPDIGKVTVLPYEKKVLSPGGYSFAGDAFFKFIDPKLQIGDSAMDIIANPSLDPAHIDLALAANRTMTPDEAYEEYKRIAEIHPKPPYQTFSLLSNERRGELLERYSASNRALFEKYMPGFPADFYLDPTA